MPFVHKNGPKAGRLGVRTFCADEKLPVWRRAMELSFKVAARKCGITAPLDGPLAATYTFCLPRLKMHSAPRYGRLPTAEKALDLDKLTRAANDSLTLAGVIVDDSRICAIRACKRYAAFDEEPGLHIEVSRIEQLQESSPLREKEEV